MSNVKRRPPAAGRGRQKGSKNRVPAELREMITAFVAANLESAQGAYDRLLKKSPSKALLVLSRFAGLVLQKQGTGTSVTVNVGAPPAGSTLTPEESYRLMLGDPTFDVSAYTIAGPATPAAAALPAAPAQADQAAALEAVDGQEVQT